MKNGTVREKTGEGKGSRVDWGREGLEESIGGQRIVE